MTCPNCDLRYEGDRCPNCGQSTWGSPRRAFAVALFVLLVIPTAAMGACSIRAGIHFDPKLSGAPIKEASLMVGLFLLFIGLVGLFWVWKLWRK